MANPKLKKVTGDIAKTKDKIADLQVKLRELEQQKTELENTEILALFRSVAVTPDELAGFIQKYKAEMAGQAAPQPQPDPEEVPADTTKQEDTDDEE